MMKIIYYNTVIMQFPSFSCYLFSLSFTHKYYTQQLVPKHSKATGRFHNHTKTDITGVL